FWFLVASYEPKIARLYNIIRKCQVKVSNWISI
ncbi:unnamed protein product, partial [marine sediment metagenome]